MKPDYEFDVAFSFAGEDRQYVEKVAGFLISKHVKVFYDKYKAAELWGKNLYTHLSAIYKDKAKHTIIFTMVVVFQSLSRSMINNLAGFQWVFKLKTSLSDYLTSDG